jgi:AAA15 family ATPase/GTPase
LDKKYCKKGPFEGHVLNDNSRRWKLILDNISKGAHGLKIQCFLMCAKKSGKCYGNNDVRFLDLSKKLQNLLLSTTRFIFWGK